MLLLVLVCLNFGNVMYAQDCKLSPDTISYIVNNAVEPATGYIHIGNFWGPLGATEVDLESILINDQYEPAFALVMNYHPDFEGKVLRIGIYLPDFSQTYAPWWDTTETTYSVSLMYEDGSGATYEGTFTAIGHISGDANGDRTINIGDPTFLINYIFRSGPMPPAPALRADANGDGTVNIGDITYLINYIFRGGQAPVHH
ncbi:MAG: dockerin type I repeat-containing protein [Candidatus Zixiibacteriota bacterium]